MNEIQIDQYLEPGEYIDSDHPLVIDFAHQHTNESQSPIEKAISLYYAVRDGFRYDPYRLDLRSEAMKASDLLTRDHGYCVEKANLLAATARVVGIPSRLGFANVRNHLGVDRYMEILKTDILVFHGYTDLFLEGKWVKATPAFNQELCTKFNVEPLEFNGKEDSLFQEFNHAGHLYMEYLVDHGTFSDLPRELFLENLKDHYPHLFSMDRLEDKGIKITL